MELEQKFEDAKLTAKKRNALKSGTFAGPNRSFPVPDRAHVIAARRLLGRAKVSSATKAKIRAKVERKAKQLGVKDDEQLPALEMAVILDSVGLEDTHDFLYWMEDVYAEEMKSRDTTPKPGDLL